jgi:hypothetical protein
MNTSPSLFVHTGSIDDEDTDNRIGGNNTIDKPLQSHFRSTKYNKNVFPSGFNTESPRSERFLRDEKDNQHDYRSLRSGSNQMTSPSNHITRPKTSFMYWASGENTEAQLDHHRMPISEHIGISPYPAGGWRQTRNKSRASSPSNNNTANARSRPESPKIREFSQDEANRWLEKQLHSIEESNPTKSIKPHPLSTDSSIVRNSIEIQTPQFEPQVP